MSWMQLVRSILALCSAGAVTAACASTPYTEPDTPSSHRKSRDPSSRSAGSGRDTSEMTRSKSRANRARFAKEGFAELERLSERARVVDRFEGEASYYADSLAGNSMASGVVYTPDRPCAAHRSLPFGTLLRVRRVSNGAHVLVRVLDRGPFGSKRRALDLSKAAAKRLGMLEDGVVAVQVEVLEIPGEAH